MPDEEVSKPVKKKPAAKKAASVAAKPAPKAKRKTTASAKRYAIAINSGSLQGPFNSVKEALDAASVSVDKDDTLTLYREVKTGKLQTKVKLG